MLTAGGRQPFSMTRWTPIDKTPQPQSTGTFPRRKRAAIPTLCSRRSIEQPEAVRGYRLPPDPRRPKWCFDDLQLDEGIRSRASAASSSWPAAPAYHAGMVGKYNMGAAAPHARWRWCWPRNSATAIRSGGRITLVIVISQSGETLDTMAALREAKRRGGREPGRRRTWWAPPSPGKRTMCSIPGPVRRSPWLPPRLTPPSWS